MKNPSYRAAGPCARGAVAALFALGIGLAPLPALAQTGARSLAGVSQAEAGQGLKEALTRGAEYAVNMLGKENGFLGNSKVKIPLPDSLQKVSQAMTLMGKGKQADKLVTSMNRAAEQAVVEARPILVDAIRTMSIDDARGILTGGEGSATRYFRAKTADTIAARFLPIVQQNTSRLKLADQYNTYAATAAGMGLIDQREANIDTYIADKAVDGLFVMIAEQEAAIRKDPIGTGSKLLETIFGKL